MPVSSRNSRSRKRPACSSAPKRSMSPTTRIGVAPATTRPIFPPSGRSPARRATGETCNFRCVCSSKPWQGQAARPAPPSHHLRQSLLPVVPLLARKHLRPHLNHPWQQSEQNSRSPWFPVPCPVPAPVQLIGHVRQRPVFHDHIQGDEDDLPFRRAFHQPGAIVGNLEAVRNLFDRLERRFRRRRYRRPLPL